MEAELDRLEDPVPLKPGDNYFTQEQFDEAARAGAVGQSVCGSSTSAATPCGPRSTIWWSA
jgi:hypothetical protein